MIFEKIKNYFIKPQEEIKKDKLEELLYYSYYQNLVPVLSFSFESSNEKLQITSNDGDLNFKYENIKKNEKEFEGSGVRAYADFDMAMLFYKLLNSYSRFLVVTEKGEESGYQQQINALKVMVVHALHKYYQQATPEVIQADLNNLLVDINELEFKQFVSKYKTQLFNRVNEDFYNKKRFYKIQSPVASSVIMTRLNRIAERCKNEECKIQLIIELNDVNNKSDSKNIQEPKINEETNDDEDVEIL